MSQKKDTHFTEEKLTEILLVHIPPVNPHSFNGETIGKLVDDLVGTLWENQFSTSYFKNDNGRCLVVFNQPEYTRFIFEQLVLSFNRIVDDFASNFITLDTTKDKVGNAIIDPMAKENIIDPLVSVAKSLSAELSPRLRQTLKEEADAQNKKDRDDVIYDG